VGGFGVGAGGGRILELMLFERLKVSGFLSFGAEGIDLELRPLNVLIGANGSGKSNLIEAFGVIKGAARHLTEGLNREGLAKEWLHKGKGEARFEAWVRADGPGPVLRHELVLLEQKGRLELGEERILDGGEGPVYDFREGNALLRNGRGIRADRVSREESVLTRLIDPENFVEFARLEASYRWMQMHRNFDFGHRSRMREAVSREIRSDHLMDGGQNVAAVLSQFPGAARREVVRCLRDVYEGIVDFQVRAGDSDIRLFVEEEGGIEIPMWRLSDGTLRYLCLLAILLHPEPPPFVVIEEPELGLHPDLIHLVAKLLRGASGRMQLVVTTHSRQLIDALGDEPEAVVVCEKQDGESRFERLDGERMKNWLDRYSLGELWGIGELGGNRW